MQNRVEKDKSPPPIRAESRRLVQGGREETGGIPLEQRAERKVGPSGRPRYRAELEWPDVLVRQEEWYRRGYCLCLFVETRAFCFHKEGTHPHELSQMRKTHGVRHHVRGQIPSMDTAEKAPSLSRSEGSGHTTAAGRHLSRGFCIPVSQLPRHHALPRLQHCLFFLSATVGAAISRPPRDTPFDFAEYRLISARLVNWPSLRMNNERSAQDELPQMRKTHGGGRAQ